ncbi:MAG: alkaline phosphatase family protein [Actinopolymorphaceae bacterium]
MTMRDTTTTTVTANGSEYAVPTRPTVVFTVDGGAMSYFTAALDAGVMPNLRDMVAGGAFVGEGLSEMPSYTNPNNMSIVTGVSPAVHGIPGNYSRTADGTERLLNEPSALRADSVHAAFQAAGHATLAVTAKDKLRRLLAHGGVPSVSSERAHELRLDAYGIDNIPELVGRPNPHIYDWEASAYAMDIGLAVHRAVGPLTLVYISLTDYVQHHEPPGSDLANRFYQAFDSRLGHYLSEGFAVGITADHGMNAKHHADGSPRVVYVEDELADIDPKVHVVLPITDPYTAHHGSLGSFAWVYVADDKRVAARERLAEILGITEVYDGDEAAVMFELPRDLAGDIAVTSDRGTALGRSRAFHDQASLPSGLRSHGGRYEQVVPVIVSESLPPRYLATIQGRPLRNRYIHDLVLNGLAAERNAGEGITCS